MTPDYISKQQHW